MPIQAVSNRKLYVQIAAQIRDLIARGEFPPGAQLPSERDLAEQFGVSRPTVREAMIALEIGGAVEVRIGVGAFVRPAMAPAARAGMDEHSPLEIMQTRRIIEPEVAALAAESIGPADQARLEATLAGMARETAEDRFERASDRALHLGIAEACGNRTLAGVMHALWQTREEAMSEHFHGFLGSMPPLRQEILGHHRDLVAAIGRHDPARARRAMAAHLEYVWTEMLRCWDLAPQGAGRARRRRSARGPC